MAPDPTGKLDLPLKDVETALYTKHLTRSMYKRIRASWMEWLTATGQPRKPISLSPGEESALDFIDYQLSSDEKDASQVWREGLAGQYGDCANQVVHAGYRITFTHDEKNDCVVVTLIGRAKDCPNYNKAMTTRHRDIDKALEMALFKQIQIFAYDSWGSTNSEALFG